MSSNKVKFKGIKYNELKAMYVIISSYSETINIKSSSFYEITTGSVLFEFAEKVKSKIEKPKLKKYDFSVPIHQAASIYIALQNSPFQDDFTKHVVRKFQHIIQEDFINRA